MFTFICWFSFSFITVYCNTSLRDGSFPDSQKNAIVTPILKKANLDAHAAANYRPISNLSYLSKLLERCVNKQLNDYLSTNNLLPSVQSAYRKFHSTESAVLKVLSDIYAAADEKMVSLLGLLDLSAAFDTVDHQILFDRLRFEYGLDGSVLSWFKSYLTNRTICVHYNGQTSETVFILYGVPQGSVLGPLLFILYVAGAINIAGKHGFAAHSYADDLQIYDHSPQSSCSSLVVRMSNCVAEINEWMGSNRLKLNPSKTELIWLGSSRRLEHCPVGELNIAGFPSSRLRTSVTSALWLTMICRCKLTSTMLHELASTICVNCKSSGALSRQTRLTLSSELLCTADSITAMGSSPVCFSTRSIGFNPFSVPQLASSLAYPSGPAFRTPCTMNYTGSPSQKGSSSNSAASFTSVYTRAHPGICLNTVYRSLRSLADHTSDLRRPVTCLCQPPPPRQLALVDSFMLVQQLGTVSLLVWRTLI